MKRRPEKKRKHGVFEFGEEDERVEKESEMLLGRFAPPPPSPTAAGDHPRRSVRGAFGSSSSSPVNKYIFLEYFAKGPADCERATSHEPIVVDDEVEDVDPGDSTPICIPQDNHALRQPCSRVDCERATSHEPIVVDDEVEDVDSGDSTPICIPQDNHAPRQPCSGVDCERAATSHEPIVVDDEVEDVDSGDSTPICIPQDNHAPRGDESIIVLSSSSNFENERNSVDSKLGHVIEMTTLSSVSTNEGSCQEQASGSLSAGHEIDLQNNEVVVFPNFFLYQDFCCTNSRISFSSSCIQVQGFCIDGTKGTFDVKWDIDDIIQIEFEWRARVDTAMVFFHFQSKVSEEGSGSAKETSGIDKLIFSVHDPFWFQGLEAIKYLDVRYKNAWIETLGIDKDTRERDSLSSYEMEILDPYLALDHKTFKDVIYPEGDPDAVTIGHKDMELLKPERFINDTLIDFYIKYLKNGIPRTQQHRFHFFNCFFFRKLADLDKDQSSACESRTSFLRVRKWTKKINLFEKDYIFIPVNYSLHWSLIVICHLGDVVNIREDRTDTPSRTPCILHMDSMRGSHRGLQNLLKSYLFEEWKERNNATDTVFSSKFENLSFISLELPQQENCFDCGLFLLHYVERFLDEAPTDFSPAVLSESSSTFLRRDWFLPKEASLKRAHIMRLIHTQSGSRFKDQSTSSLETYIRSQVHTTNNLEDEMQDTDEIYTSPKASGCYSTCRKTVLWPGFSPPPVPYLEQGEASGLRSTELLEPGTSVKSIYDGTCRNRGAHNCRKLLSPVEENEGCEEPLSGKVNKSSKLIMHTQPVNYYAVDSPESPEVELVDDDLHPNSRELRDAKEVVDYVSSSTASEDLASLVVEDSEEVDSFHNLNIGDYSPSSPPANANNLPSHLVSSSSPPNVNSQSNFPETKETTPDRVVRKEMVHIKLRPNRTLV